MTQIRKLVHLLNEYSYIGAYVLDTLAIEELLSGIAQRSTPHLWLWLHECMRGGGGGGGEGMVVGVVVHEYYAGADTGFSEGGGGVMATRGGG